MEQELKTAWDRQMLIRDKNRPTIRDYLPLIFHDFYELHGDRGVGDDGAILGGIGFLKDVPVTVLAEVKGRNIQETRLPILPCRTRRDTGRHCVWRSRQKNSIGRSFVSSTHPVHSAAWKLNSVDKVKPLPAT